MRWLCFLLALLPLVAAAAAEKKNPLEALVVLLANTEDPAIQRDILRGISDAVVGRREMKAPKGWSAIHERLSKSSDEEIRERSMTLSVLFGDPGALKSLRTVLNDAKADAAARNRALAVLLDKRGDEMPALLRSLLDDPAVRSGAIRGLARFDDPMTPKELLERYAKWSADEKAEAIATLVSRSKYALAMLDAMEKKEIARGDLSSFQARQVAALKDAKVSERLNSVWGTLRPASKDKEKLLAKYRPLTTPQQRKNANLSLGRATFTKLCAQCHLLYGEGAKIGPDLTGSQRTNPEYILTKVLDPNAVVPADYQVSRIVTGAGRVVTGVVKQENEKQIVVQTPTEELRINKSDIEERSKLTLSLMPEGQLDPLSDLQVRDLLAYLAGDKQVPLPAK
jgi:putative heme-binding domain-containing protein